VPPQFPAAVPVETNGIIVGVHEAGEGPAILLCHGFPELAYSWRHQVPALVGAGYRVIAPDQRGYNGSTAPEDVTDCTVGRLVDDLVGVLDALGVDRAVAVGHDWGGAVVWGAAQSRPDRFHGVVGVCTPWAPRGETDPISAIIAARGPTTYMQTFQAPGVAEAILGADVEAAFRAMLRGRGVTLAEFMAAPPEVQAVPAGVFVGDPQLLGDPIVSEEELRVYVDAYERHGFTGPLNWYRSAHRHWRETADWPDTITVPALMISAGDDWFLPPQMSEPMGRWIPDFERHVIPDAAHWVQQEKPDELNALLLDWLGRRFPPAN
jgi:pimeloyl-ACP methyl ester carboxylesterase